MWPWNRQFCMTWTEATVYKMQISRPILALLLFEPPRLYHSFDMLPVTFPGIGRASFERNILGELFKPSSQFKIDEIQRRCSSGGPNLSSLYTWIFFISFSCSLFRLIKLNIYYLAIGVNIFSCSIFLNWCRSRGWKQIEIFSNVFHCRIVWDVCGHAKLGLKEIFR